MNFDLFSALVQTVIAILAFLISVLEVKKARKAKEEEQLIEQIEFDIVQAIDSISFGEKMKELLDLDYSSVNEDMEKYGGEVNELLDEYLAFCKSLEKPYLQLLKDEKRFSLSYGFGRYINAFRDFLSFQGKVQQCRKPIDDLCKTNKAFDEKPELKAYVLHCARVMAQLTEVYPNATVAEIKSRYEEWQRKKYPDYSIDANVTEKAVAAYFAMFMEVRGVTDQLKKKYEEFEPYLREIKLKFESHSKGEERK